MEHARPPAELVLEGGPASRAEAWRKWKKQFMVFLKASGVSKETSDVRSSLLVNLIGAAGYEVYSTFTFTEKEEGDIDVLIKKFDGHFGTKPNVTVARYKFFIRNQEQGENIDQWVTSLRLLSQTCEFGELTESLIRDRIVCGISSSTVRDRLLRSDELTLAKAVQICQAAEMSHEESRCIDGGSNDVHVDAVWGSSERAPGGGSGRAAAGGRRRASGRRGARRGASRPAGAAPAARPSRPCAACGGVWCVQDDRCPANSVLCYVCDKRGHFAKVCSQRGGSRNQVCDLAVDDSDDDGCNISSYIANSIGRKSCLLLAAGLNFVGSMVLANAGSMAALLTGRIITGVATGAIDVIDIIYIGEIASPKIRGSLTTLSGISHMIGTLLVYSIGPYVTFAAVGYVCVAITCAHTLALCYIPESPVYLVLKGKLDKAELVLHDLGRADDIDEELRQITENVNETMLSETHDDQGRQRKRWRTLIFEKKNRKAFLITTVLFCLQAGGGVVAVILFATTIFKNAQSSVDPNIGTIILGLTELCGGVFTPLLIERSGRRVLLLMSLGCCSLCMGILGTYFYLEVNYYVMIKSIRWLPLVLLMICLFTYNIGLSVVPNTLTGEMYSPPLRSIGSSISISISWCLALATCSSFGYIVAALRNHGVFWLYSAIYVFGFVFTIIVVPETKGKSLLEVGQLLER